MEGESGRVPELVLKTSRSLNREWISSIPSFLQVRIMKRLGVAGIIRGMGKNSLCILMGRRGKDPNRGLYVLPGGGVEDGETLEQAFCREMMEETGLKMEPSPYRWKRPDVIELPDRIILVGEAQVAGLYKPNYNDTPRDGGDLYDVKWFRGDFLPRDTSPTIMPVLRTFGFNIRKDLDGWL
jgi:ADP-ribose pyrophosphatase YjhB (NUDIX family)